MYKSVKCYNGEGIIIFGSTENARRENDGPSKSQGVKMQDMKTHNMKMQDMKLQDMKMQDVKIQDTKIEGMQQLSTCSAFYPVLVLFSTL